MILKETALTEFTSVLLVVDNLNKTKFSFFDYKILYDGTFDPLITQFFYH